jgi:hypothetical protein
VVKIVLSDGKEVWRSWDGRGWRFDVHAYNATDAPVISLRPTPHEAKQLSILFNGDDLGTEKAE